MVLLHGDEAEDDSITSATAFSMASSSSSSPATPVIPSFPTMSGSPATRSKSILNRNAVLPVYQFWKTFDLDSKRLVFDSQGSAMKLEKDNSLKSRKKLAEATKHFRKLGDAEKVSSMGNLLRSYQEEIDNLTKRAKFSENAFFGIYKALYAAPDPVACLESLLDPKWNELEEDNKQLRKEIKEYEVEFASLKNQDITIRKLEEQIATFESQLDSLVEKQAKDKCRELEETLQTKTVEFDQQRVDLERHLANSRAEVREAFAKMDAMQSDFFAQRQQRELAKSSFDQEIEVMSQETLLIQTLQLENAQLKKKVDELLSFSSTGGAAGVGATNSFVASGSLTTSPRTASRQEITKLQMELDSVKHQLVVNAEAAQEAREKLEKQIQQQQEALENSQAQLATRPTLEQHQELLNQLRVLKELECNSMEDEIQQNSTSLLGSKTETLNGRIGPLYQEQQPSGTSSQDPSVHISGGASGASGASSGGSSGVWEETERILVSRVRRLERALKQKDIELERRRYDIEQVQKELVKKNDTLQQKMCLLKQLEENVDALEAKATQQQRQQKATRVMAGSDMKTELLLEAMEAQDDDGIDALGGGTESVAGRRQSATSTYSTAAASGGIASDSKMFEIVRGQRDRFRDRMKELEADKNRLEQTVQSLRNSVSRLENDNMQLYQKIRFLQSYRGGKMGSSRHQIGVSDNDDELQISVDDGEYDSPATSVNYTSSVETKYQNLYEEKMNPFAQFNRMESQQRYTNLNTVDKILLNSARMFLGHRITRTFAFGYIVLLHFLVFATLYSFMHGCGVSNG